MSNYAISLKRTGLLLAALTFTALLMVVNLASFFGKASAAQLTSRNVVLASNLEGDVGTAEAANSELNGADTTHTFTFNIATTASIGGIQLLYCTTAIGTCTAPTGLSVDNATLGSPTGLTGWSEDSDTANQYRLENATPEAKTAGNTVVIPISDVINPTSIGTYFVRVTTYTADTFVTQVDDGTVAFAITTGIQITARVAETLGFSTTGAVNATDIPAETGACVPLTGSGAIYLGDPTEHTLALTTAYDNYSAFRVYTNAASGVSINYEGSTLTKAGTAQTITAINNGVAADGILSIEGSEQFGLGIDLTAGDDVDNLLTANSITGTDNIDVTNVDPAADLGGGAGEITVNTNYDEADGVIDTNATEDAEFSFVPDTVSEIADSAGYVECNTAVIRYLANIAPTTEAGTYTTTLVYSAVPTY